MKRLADGVEQLDGFPPQAVNVYPADGVLIDSGSGFDRRRILRQFFGHGPPLRDTGKFLDFIRRLPE